ncbi:MAG: hypothetical protein WBQ26_11130 [Gemmatimonadaceae bacterium]
MHVTPVVAAVLGSLFFSPAIGAGLGDVAAPTDACALITQAEVSAELGVTVGPGAHIVDTDPQQCKWIEPGKDETTAKFVMLAMETTMRFKFETSPMPGRITEPLAGVGDAAVYVGTAGYSPALSVKKGTSAFQIRVLGFPDAEVKAREKALALKAVGRL